MTFLANAQTTTEYSLFQCQPTTDQSGQVFAPNIPDSYFNDANARYSRTWQGGRSLIRQNEVNGTTFIYTTPPEPSCSGTVLALQYCYQTKNNQIGDTDREFFRFLHLSRSGYHFTVDDLIIVKTSPQWDYCTNLWSDQSICCDISTFAENDQFHIPASNYTFGVVIRNDNIRPLAFSSTSMEYQFPHFQASNNSGPDIGAQFSLRPGDFQSPGSLLLLRFLIGMFMCTLNSC